MSKEDDYKEVADKTDETKDRINKLIMSAHKYAMSDDDYHYVKTLSRFYVELRNKLIEKERITLDNEWVIMDELKVQYGNNLFTEKYKSNMRNPKYMEGWTLIIKRAKKIEFIMMDYAEKHNILSSNKNIGNNNSKVL